MRHVRPTLVYKIFVPASDVVSHKYILVVQGNLFRKNHCQIHFNREKSKKIMKMWPPNCTFGYNFRYRWKFRNLECLRTLVGKFSKHIDPCHSDRLGRSLAYRLQTSNTTNRISDLYIILIGKIEKKLKI